MHREAAVGRALLLLLLVLGGAGCASTSRGGAPESRAQVAFGIDMARRGLWSEAVFRFEQARGEHPADFRVLNNLAVAYEAVGRFDDALATYREALRLAPGDRNLRQNSSRFFEFYQSYRPGGATAPAAATPPPATESAPEPESGA
jgi:tetratricopeptide (TPR) repeat protein